MSDIQIYLLEVDRNNSQALSYARNTSHRLETKELKLLELIESLGEYLNSEDVVIRARTISYLADVLLNLPPRVLSRQQREHLNDFVLSRLSNGAEAPGHCARAQVALEALGTFDDERLSRLTFTLLDNLSPLVQFKQQSERFEVLKLFDLLFTKYRNSLGILHSQNDKFIQRLLTCLDGEKDPRNLMIIFSILNVPMVEWNISSDSQDLFEAVFNYFPITFRPPPNDPYGITTKDLKDRLRDCISSTGYFAPHSFPALLDKLDSTSPNVKRDALQTLQACATRYGPSTVNLYAITLWDAVKFETLNAQEDDLADEALRVLFSLGRTISNSTHEGPLQSYLKPICKECNEHLEDTPTKQSSATGRILEAVSESSAESASIITKAILPQLLRFCQSTDNIPRRRGLLEVLVKLVKAHAAVFGHWRKSDASTSLYRDSGMVDLVSSPNVLSEYSEQALNAFTSAIESTSVSEVSFRSLALEGLENLATVRGLLDSPSITGVVQQLTSIIINEEPYGRDVVKAKSIDALVSISRQKPQLVMENAIPAFMAELPDNDITAQKPYVPILEAFAKLSIEPQIFNTIVIRLKNKLYSTLRQNSSVKYTTSILSAILYAFDNDDAQVSRSPEFLAPYYAEIVIPFLKDIVSGSRDCFPNNLHVANEDVLDLIGRISNSILRALKFAAQTEMGRNIYTLFRAVDMATLPPFQIVSRDQSLTMLTSLHLLAALHPQIVPHTDLNVLLEALVNYATNTSTPPAVAGAATAQISLLANKYIEPADVTRIIIPHIGESSSLLSATTIGPPNLRVAFALIKALVFRADPQLKSLLPGLLNHLAHPAHGKYTARLFAMLIADDLFMTKRNHCKIYGIYRQRFFSLAAPLLISSYRSAANTEASTETGMPKSNYLAALTGMIQHVTYELLRPQLEDLTPPLLQSLALEDADTKAGAIATISKIVIHDPQILESHAASLISRLLDVASSKPSPSGNNIHTPAPKYPQLQAPGKINPASHASTPKARAAALACLTSFVGSLKDETLVPYQRQTAQRLAGVLDDPKRAVRTEAVRCRAAWSGLVAADEDEDDF